MPTYTYQCEACGNDFEMRRPMSESADPQPCPECGGNGKRTIGETSFILKGDDWPGKNIKIKGQMALKNRILDKKQNERKREAPGIKLAPNVGGERVESWAEAKSLAESQGKNTASYDPKIREEKSK